MNPIPFCAQCGEQPPKDHSTSTCPVKDEDVDKRNKIVQQIRTFSQYQVPDYKNLIVTNFANAAKVLRGQSYTTIDTVVNMTEENHAEADIIAFMMRPRTRYAWFPSNDDEKEQILERHFEDFAKIVDQSPPYSNILVHGRAGISRSVTMVMAYLMPANRTSYYETLRQVRLERPLAWPSSAFKRQLEMFYFTSIVKRIYVAGKWTEKEHIQELQEKFKSMGKTITHDWTRYEADPNNSRADMAIKDIEGVQNADCVVAIMTDKDYPYRGTYSEIGGALTLNKQVYVVCPFKDGKEAPFITNVFYDHPAICHLDSEDELFRG